MNAQTRVSDSSSSRAGAASAVNAQRRGFAAGITLTEALVSMVIVAVVAMGGLSYEYLAAKHSLIARAQTTAARTAQLLIEDWKSTEYTGTLGEYDPSALGLGFQPLTVAAEPASLTLGPYSIEVDGFPMIVTLQYYDVEYDAANAEHSLRQLTVIASFAQVNSDLTIASEPWMGIPPIVLTTYVNRGGR